MLFRKKDHGIIPAFAPFIPHNAWILESSYHSENYAGIIASSIAPSICQNGVREGTPVHRAFIYHYYLAAKHLISKRYQNSAFIILLQATPLLGGVHKQVSVTLNVKMTLGRGVLTHDIIKSADPAYVPVQYSSIQCSYIIYSI